MITELKPTNLIAIEVPLDANNFKIAPEHLQRNWLEYPDKTGCTKIPVPLGEYNIVGEVISGFILFDCEKYVEKHFVENIDAHSFYAFKNYTSTSIHDYVFKKKEFSFRSLLKANNVYYINPIGKRPLEKDFVDVWDFVDEENKWEMFENMVVKGKLLIIEKINDTPAK